MKAGINFNILLILLIIIVTSSCYAIKYIPDATFNATAAFADLDGTQKNDFLFFSFDFDYHSEVKSNEKYLAFFKINTDFKLLASIKYTFINKEIDKINQTDIDIADKQRLWKMSLPVNVKSIGNENEYYVKITKFGPQNSKHTAILGIPVYKNKGQITIENVLILPEDIINKMNIPTVPNFSIIDDIKKDLNKYLNDALNNNGQNTNNYKNNHNNYHSNHHYFDSKKIKYDKYENPFPINPSDVLLFLFGLLLFSIWIFVMILYFLVNRRKQTQLVQIIPNRQ